MKDDSGLWGDGKLKIVCEIFADQVRAKNRSGSHLNKLGYANVIAQFKEKTGKTYTKLQFKNKWEEITPIGNSWAKKRDVVGTLLRNCMKLQIGGGKR